MTISNERLAEMVGAGVPCVPASPGEIVAIVQELRSRRQSPAGVEPVGYTSAGELERLSEWFEHADAIGVVGQHRGARTIPLYASPPKAVTITDEMVERAADVFAKSLGFAGAFIEHTQAAHKALVAALSSEAKA